MIRKCRPIIGSPSNEETRMLTESVTDTVEKNPSINHAKKG